VDGAAEVGVDGAVGVAEGSGDLAVAGVRAAAGAARAGSQPGFCQVVACADRVSACRAED
jgi:hypothetical protein